MNELTLRADDKGILMDLRVRPRGRGNKIEGVREGAVLLSVTAAPENGKANAAVIDFLAKTLRTAKSSLLIERGQSSRNQTVRVADLTEAEVRELLSLVLSLEEKIFNEPEARATGFLRRKISSLNPDSAISTRWTMRFNFAESPSL
ncbi:MAG TPA: DUF167 domain-containing protein, partial [Abditibacteriaceae bacterium]|nr:DUF167 domain-containing protein [Abditibacteriaceae bacterium]